MYREHWLGLVRLAALTTGSRALAEEIVQDAFVALYRRWDEVDNPGAYVRLAVVHGCTDWVRRRQTERRRLRLLAPNPSTSDPTPLDDVLAVLSPRQRTAIVLRFYEDWSETAIADALGCRKGTVKSLIHRSVKRLREEMST